MDKVLITDAALESLIVHACLSIDGVESMWKGLKEHSSILGPRGSRASRREHHAERS